MINRRRFMLGTGAFAATGARAQGAGVPRKRIAWVSTDGASGNAGFAAFRSGLAARGYVDGRDVVIETRASDLPFSELEPFALEVLASRPDIIVTQGPVVRTIRKVGTSIPVVFGFSGEPVVAGLIDSFARPGGNFTGISFMAFDLVGKRVELLHEVAPAVRRVAIIANPEHPGESEELRVSTEATIRVGLAADYFPIRATSDLDAALVGVRSAGSGAIVVLPDAGMMRLSERIAFFGREQRIAAISGWAVFARRGNVLSYGPVLEASFGRLAWYVDRILKGARPADLPVELPSKVELVVNLPAASAIDLTIPRSVLARADEVIR
jgi:putative tryptophan/tyrosine transport system substrate-binding protein